MCGWLQRWVFLGGKAILKMTEISPSRGTCPTSASNYTTCVQYIERPSSNGVYLRWYLSYSSCDLHHTYPVLLPNKVIRNTSLILVLHNNGCTGIDQPNTYSRRLKMTKQKQMTEKELDQVSGGLITIFTNSASFKQKGTKAEILTGGNSSK